VARIGKQLRADSAWDVVDVAQSRPVSWGGGSLTQAMFDVLTRAVDIPDWDWIVNLSAHCMPLRSPDHLARFLEREHREKGRLAFCNAFNLKRDYEPYAWSDAPLDQERAYARIVFRCDAEIAADIDAGRFDPARDVTHRRKVRFMEVGKNLFEVHRMRPKEAAPVRPPRFGRQWVALHRSLVDRIVTDPRTQTVLDDLITCFISDESFFQELLMTDFLGVSDFVAARNLHFQGGGARPLDEARFQDALESPAFFVRKVPADQFETYLKIARDHW